MTLQLFAHPFSSYCWKVLIALYENATPFTFRMLDPEGGENHAEWDRRWPFKRMPVLVDNELTIVESDAIVEHLDRRHPGPVRLLPDDPDEAVEVRMLTSILDAYVMTPVFFCVRESFRPADARDPFGVAEALTTLDRIYPWLDARVEGRCWTAGERFTLADCAAGPFLFYADWVRPIPERFTTLRAHRAKLLARPSVARCVEDARPYRPLFPLGAPDRD